MKVDVLALIDALKVELAAKLDEISVGVQGLADAGSSDDLQKKIEELQAQVASLQSDKDALVASLAKDEGKIEAAKADLNA